MINRIQIIMVGLIAVLLSLVLILENTNDNSNNAPVESPRKQVEPKTNAKVNIPEDPKEMDYWINDSLYTWDDRQINWVTNGIYDESKSKIDTQSLNKTPVKEPITLKWDILMDIEYRLKYFEKIQGNAFSPIFTEKIKKLNGKEVVIKGFVIPFDEEGELLALSYNPYSSCFFCGKASPASVLSMYMQDKDILYKLDDFKKFKGTLILNHDDPDQFYYILKNVVPI